MGVMDFLQTPSQFRQPNFAIAGTAAKAKKPRPRDFIDDLLEEEQVRRSTERAQAIIKAHREQFNQEWESDPTQFDMPGDERLRAMEEAYRQREDQAARNLDDFGIALPRPSQRQAGTELGIPVGTTAAGDWSASMPGAMDKKLGRIQEAMNKELALTPAQRVMPDLTGADERVARWMASGGESAPEPTARQMGTLPGPIGRRTVKRTPEEKEWSRQAVRNRGIARGLGIDPALFPIWQQAQQGDQDAQIMLAGFANPQGVGAPALAAAQGDAAKADAQVAAMERAMQEEKLNREARAQEHSAEMTMRGTQFDTTESRQAREHAEAMGNAAILADLTRQANASKDAQDARVLEIERQKLELERQKDENNRMIAEQTIRAGLGPIERAAGDIAKGMTSSPSINEALRQLWEEADLTNWPIGGYETRLAEFVQIAADNGIPEAVAENWFRTH